MVHSDYIGVRRVSVDAFSLQIVEGGSLIVVFEGENCSATNGGSFFSCEWLKSLEVVLSSQSYIIEVVLEIRILLN